MTRHTTNNPMDCHFVEHLLLTYVSVNNSPIHPPQVFSNPVGEEWVSLHAYRSSLDPDSAAAPDAGSSDHPTTAVGSSAIGGSGRTTASGRGRGKRHLRESDVSTGTCHCVSRPRKGISSVFMACH